MTFNIPLNYRPLSAATLPGYLARNAALRERLGGRPEDWTLREVSDGYSHFAELETIAEPDRKGAAEAGALSLARAFLLEPRRFASIADILDEAPRHRRAPGARFAP